MRLGMGEMLIILIVALLIFGPTKLPQLGDSLGKAIRGFRRATSGEDETAGQALPPATGLPPSAAGEASPEPGREAARRA